MKLTLPADWEAIQAQEWKHLHHLRHAPCGWMTPRPYDLDIDGPIGPAQAHQVVYNHVCRQDRAPVTLDRTRYVWVRDEEPVTGTLSDYARMWSTDYYSGENTLSGYVLTWDGETDPVKHLVRIIRGFETADDWIPVEISVNGELVHVSIDARA